MAELIYFVTKDALILKPAKKPSSSLFRMILLVFSMLCGVYIVLLCLKQINIRGITRLSDIRVIEVPYAESNLGAAQQASAPLLHYPTPKTFNRLECEHNPVRLFAIISMQRSGSGWFETLLNSHTNLSSNGEILSPKHRRENISQIIENLDKVYNLDWLTSASKNECTAAIGFKWMLNQGLMEYHKEIGEYFKSRDVSAIFLFRRNILRRMVSLLANSYDSYAKLLNGTHKSHVHSLEEASALSQYKPVLNSTTLVSELNKVQERIKKALMYYSGTRHIILYYEDLVKNQTKLKEVQEFLGLPVKELTSRQVKIHKGPLSDLIENWDEVNRSLNGTAYEIFTQDPDY